MQFEDPRSIFEAAAAKPTWEIDARALLRQGRRMRRARFAAAIVSVAIVVTTISVATGFMGPRSGGGIPPTGPSGDGCREIAGRISGRFSEDLTTRAEVARDRLRREVRRLRDQVREQLHGAEDAGVAGDDALRREVEAMREALEVAEDELQDVSAQQPPEDKARRSAPSAEPRPCENDDATPDEPTPVWGRVEMALRRARCSAEPPGFVDPPTVGHDEWCTFEVAFGNSGKEEVALDEDVRLLYVDASATLTFSTAYIDGRPSPKIAVRIRAGETVTRTLHFAVDPGSEPTALVFGEGEDAMRLPFTLDCFATVPSEVARACDPTPDRP